MSETAIINNIRSNSTNSGKGRQKQNAQRKLQRKKK